MNHLSNALPAGKLGSHPLTPNHPMSSPTVDLDRDRILLGDLTMFSRLGDTRNPTQDEIRLHASAVRRLLLDGLLPMSAASRGMPIAFHVPDAQHYIRAARNNNLMVFQLAGVAVFGIEIAGGCVSKGGSTPGAGFDPSHRISMRLESFLRQMVAYAGGEVLTRHEILLYVANKVGGVHYDPAPSKKLTERKIRALGILRRTIRIGIVGDMPSIQFNPQAAEDHSATFRYEPEYIDAVYLEFLACIGHIIHSPEVQALQTAIATDLRNR